jgi:TPR repeat protein
MLKYYENAIEHGCINSMNNLGLYYETIGEYDKMKTLLERAISKGSNVAMYNMGY